MMTQWLRHFATETLLTAVISINAFSQNSKTTECPNLGGTQEDNQVQLLAPHRSTLTLNLRLLTQR